MPAYPQAVSTDNENNHGLNVITPEPYKPTTIVPFFTDNVVEKMKLRQLATDIVKRHIPNWRNIKIDKSDPHAIHFGGASGGVDSSTMIVCLALLNPDVTWHALFTDTGDDPDCVPELLDWIQELTGITIVRIKEADLYEEIGKNGFLPSAKNRWCTGLMKIDPWERYIKEQFTGDDPDNRPRVFAYSGITYDERERTGIIGIDGVTTLHPFADHDVAVDRQQVCAIASELSLINSSYFRGRSRSGCSSCPFQTKQEWISLRVWDRKRFDRAMSVEKMPEYLLDRFSIDSTFCVKDMGFYTLYPMSAIVKGSKSSLEVQTIFNSTDRIDDAGRITWDYEPLINKPTRKSRKPVVKPKPVEDQLDMFGLDDATNASDAVTELEPSTLVINEQETTLYVAIEHYKSDLSFGMSDDMNDVWQSRLITYSTSQGGLTRSLHGYYFHRAMASSSAWDDIEHYDRESHITVAVITFPKGVIPKIDYTAIDKEEKAFGWAQGRCLAELDYVITCINRVCDLHRSKEIVSRAKLKGKYTRLSMECRDTLERYEAAGSPNIGQVVGIGHYRPKPIAKRTIDDSYDEDVKHVKCFACSI